MENSTKIRTKTIADERLYDNTCNSSRKHNKVKVPEKRIFNSIFKQLLRKSSVQAVSQIGHSPNPFRKVVWIFILMGGLTISCYQGFRFLKVYLQYPIVVTLQLGQKQLLEFPAVTVCNLNRMKSKYFECLNSSIPLVKCYRPGIVIDQRKPNLIMSERSGLHSCSSEFSGNSSAEKDYTVEFLKTYLAVSGERRKEAGYKSEEFIKSCSFNGKSCSGKDFVEFQNLRYGNCFTFNSFNQNTSKPLTISRTGDSSGLVLSLYLSAYSYMNLTSTIGARVIIHDRKEDPSPEETGINIAIGYETLVGLTQAVIRRLPAPYRDHCEEYENRETWPYHESYNKCIRDCIQEINFRICGCVDLTLPAKTSRKLCSLTDKSEMCCLDDVLRLLLEQNTTCDCPLPCSTTNYREKISVSRWPSEASVFTGEARGEYRYEFRDFRESWAKLKVYYTSFERKIYEQRPMFHESEIYSHIGGELALWLGMSLMVIFELLEVVGFLTNILLSLLWKFNSKV
ncbi:amiloride-sensitive sodium channel subunit beta [Nephila pilipes]|uniref:Amiloride-sensitive sodium channel subunit beta n=1 Tax=Nephila pilipes TaxID=299642 RepID=A0A8X6MBF7_NEPPI|nr:amiloride-sensitive sodium channel subunit beta [Nephila pilipes]